jgi:hypothetical protein
LKRKKSRKEIKNKKIAIKIIKSRLNKTIKWNKMLRDEIKSFKKQNK